MSQQNILIVERESSSGNVINYIKKDDKVIPKKKSALHLSYIYVINFFKEIFLPQGYPESVSEDYLEYQIWDTAQAFCSTITGSFTTRSILKTVGVGNAEATALSATVTWILKDGSGMIGRIIFAWWKGNGLDADCKKWRLVADILNDIAMLIELVLPYYSSYSMLILCITSTMKSIVGTAGGATRAAITHHQAIKDNMAEISAKDGTQETLVNLVASVISIYLLNVISSGIFEWIFIFFLIVLHLLTNYLAVKALVFKNFNDQRLLLAMKSYFSIGTVLSPQKTNYEEAVFLGFSLKAKHLCGYKILLGSSLKSVLRKCSANDLEQLINFYNNKEYFLLVDNQYKNIYVSFEKEESVECIVMAYFHAVCLGIATSLFNGHQLSIYPNRQLGRTTPIARITDFMKRFGRSSNDQSFLNIPILHFKDLQLVMQQECEMFKTALDINGWQLNSHCLNIGEWRVQWKDVNKKQM